jgi:hypothetical protein
MSQATLFLSRFLLGIWVVLVSAFLFLLLSNAPSAANAPFASISIDTSSTAEIHLPNRIFACTETEQQFQCQTKLQNGLLDLRFTKAGSYKYGLSNCRALYNGQPAGCQEIGQTYAPMLKSMYGLTGLGLSPEQLQAVWQEHWGINAIMRWGELRLIWITAGLSLVAGVSIALIAWLSPGKFSKVFTGFACGYGVYHFIGGVLGRIQYDAVTPYGFTPDTWDWFVWGGAIAAGFAAMIFVARLLWQRFNRLSELLIALVSGVGVCSLCWLFLSWNLTAVFLQSRYLAIFLSAALALLAAGLLWLHTARSLRVFVCLGSGVGALALATNVLLLTLFGLGYID